MGLENLVKDQYQQPQTQDSSMPMSPYAAIPPIDVPALLSGISKAAEETPDFFLNSAVGLHSGAQTLLDRALGADTEQDPWKSFTAHREADQATIRGIPVIGEKLTNPRGEFDIGSQVLGIPRRAIADVTGNQLALSDKAINEINPLSSRGLQFGAGYLGAGLPLAEASGLNAAYQGISDVSKIVNPVRTGRNLVSGLSAGALTTAPYAGAISDTPQQFGVQLGAGGALGTLGGAFDSADLNPRIILAQKNRATNIQIQRTQIAQNMAASQPVQIPTHSEPIAAGLRNQQGSINIPEDPLNTLFNQTDSGAAPSTKEGLIPLPKENFQEALLDSAKKLGLAGQKMIPTVKDIKSWGEGVTDVADKFLHTLPNQIEEMSPVMGNLIKQADNAKVLTYGHVTNSPGVQALKKYIDSAKPEFKDQFNILIGSGDFEGAKRLISSYKGSSPAQAGLDEVRDFLRGEGELAKSAGTIGDTLETFFPHKWDWNKVSKEGYPITDTFDPSKYLGKKDPSNLDIDQSQIGKMMKAAEAKLERKLTQKERNLIVSEYVENDRRVIGRENHQTVKALKPSDLDYLANRGDWFTAYASHMKKGISKTFDADLLNSLEGGVGNHADIVNRAKAKLGKVGEPATKDELAGVLGEATDEQKIMQGYTKTKDGEWVLNTLVTPDSGRYLRAAQTVAKIEKGRGNEVDATNLSHYLSLLQNRHSHTNPIFNVAAKAWLSNLGSAVTNLGEIPHIIRMNGGLKEAANTVTTYLTDLAKKRAMTLKDVGHDPKTLESISYDGGNLLNVILDKTTIPFKAVTRGVSEVNIGTGWAGLKNEYKKDPIAFKSKYSRYFKQVFEEGGKKAYHLNESAWNSLEEAVKTGDQNSWEGKMLALTKMFDISPREMDINFFQAKDPDSMVTLGTNFLNKWTKKQVSEMRRRVKAEPTNAGKAKEYALTLGLVIGGYSTMKSLYKEAFLKSQEAITHEKPERKPTFIQETIKNTTGIDTGKESNLAWNTADTALGGAIGFGTGGLAGSTYDLRQASNPKDWGDVLGTAVYPPIGLAMDIGSDIGSIPSRISSGYGFGDYRTWNVSKFANPELGYPYYASGAKAREEFSKAKSKATRIANGTAKELDPWATSSTQDDPWADLGQTEDPWKGL